MVAGGFGNIAEEGSYEFADVKVTGNADYTRHGSQAH